MTTKPDSEDALENATIDLLMNNGWGEWANCIGETTQNFPVTGRSDRQEVVLYDRLRAALKRLNPDIPAEGLSEAVDTLTRDRSAMLLPQANQEVYGYLKNGIRVNYQENGRPQMKLVQVIDWKNWAENDFFLTQQMWITGDVYTRRADVIGFVNGLPLLFIELKRSSVSVERAYEDNLRDYKNTIPQLFWYNAVVLLSNGRDARLGSLTSPLAHYGRWKKINSEGEEGRIDLETILLAACRPSRLLDLIENFTVFSEGVGGLSKIVAKNHQFLGVNNAIGAVHQIQENRGRLGVFWHTQGSGKSYSMLFFAQKTLRKIQGNWTFVIITDRRDLDDQIYKNFAAAGAVTEPETTVRAQSANHLRQLLQEDHRYVFTLIQKFRTDPGEVYPVLSERSDIIVMTDEAHRSQYDTLAQNMRNALPNAAFIGFTGTPLMAGEEKTREVFGDYVSIYDFSQSIEDEATVPLFYENRIPSVQLTNEHFNEELEALLEEAALDEDQEKKLEREFAREYHIITRDDRLEKVAQDIVSHFVGRGYRGKGMVVSIDKLTAARLYQKVARHWSITLAQLHGELADCDDEMRRDILQDDIKFMETTDLGLVISQSQNEIDFFKEHDFDILPHRKLMESGQVDTRFKDPEDSLRLVFVCAMWLTGFDAPSVSTVYLDKPMRNHTLMQTIARANRVFKGKINGTIVDYIGVFRNLQEALAIYGEGVGGQVPVQPKEELISQLASALSEGRSFCAKLGVDILSIVETDDPFSRIAKIENGVERILKTDETKKTFLAISGLINRLFKAILPDPAANPYWGERSAFKAVADHIHSLTPSADISEVMTGIEELLDRSIEGYKIGDGRAPYNVGGIDFDAIRKMFEKGKKRTAAARLRGQIEQQLDKMIQQNKSRLDYAKKLQEMIKAYNEGITGVDEFMQQLFDLSNALEEESKRAIREGLEEEELAIFDILLKPRPELTKEDLKQVKAVAKTMLDTLKAEVLLLDWRHQQQRRSAVRVRIEALLDELPDSYESGLFDEKCDAVYDHVYENYQGGGASIYGV